MNAWQIVEKGLKGVVYLLKIPPPLKGKMLFFIRLRFVV
jgi:hypothetical protein